MGSSAGFGSARCFRDLLLISLSADYIHLYHGNAALLSESLEVIQRTAALIFSALETKEEAEQPDTAPTTEQPTTNATDAVLAEVA